MNKQSWIIFGAICAIVIGVLVWFSVKGRADVSGVDSQTVLSASDASGGIADRTFGKTDSKVVLIEYGDYQCPGCYQAYPAAKAVSEKYKDQIAFVFRNFPITSKHPNARAAAAAVEAAGLQGKYWEMHDVIFENQSEWESLDGTKRAEYFTEQAKKLDLNTETFAVDVASANVNKKISFDQALAKKDEIVGTPAFFLNGKQLEDNIGSDQEKLDAAVKDALKAEGITLPQDAS